MANTEKQDTTLDNPLGSYILHYMFVDEKWKINSAKEYTAAAPYFLIVNQS